VLLERLAPLTRSDDRMSDESGFEPDVGSDSGGGHESPVDDDVMGRSA